MSPSSTSPSIAESYLLPPLPFQITHNQQAQSQQQHSSKQSSTGYYSRRMTSPRRTGSDYYSDDEDFHIDAFDDYECEYITRKKFHRSFTINTNNVLISGNGDLTEFDNIPRHISSSPSSSSSSSSSASASPYYTSTPGSNNSRSRRTSISSSPSITPTATAPTAITHDIVAPRAKQQASSPTWKPSKFINSAKHKASKSKSISPSSTSHSNQNTSAPDSSKAMMLLMMSQVPPPPPSLVSSPPLPPLPTSSSHQHPRSKNSSLSSISMSRGRSSSLSSSTSLSSSSSSSLFPTTSSTSSITSLGDSADPFVSFKKVVADQYGTSVATAASANNSMFSPTASAFQQLDLHDHHSLQPISSLTNASSLSIPNSTFSSASSNESSATSYSCMSPVPTFQDVDTSKFNNSKSFPSRKLAKKISCTSSSEEEDEGENTPIIGPEEPTKNYYYYSKKNGQKQLREHDHARHQSITVAHLRPLPPTPTPSEIEEFPSPTSIKTIKESKKTSELLSQQQRSNRHSSVDRTPTLRARSKSQSLNNSSISNSATSIQKTNNMSSVTRFGAARTQPQLRKRSNTTNSSIATSCAASYTKNNTSSDDEASANCDAPIKPFATLSDDILVQISMNNTAFASIPEDQHRLLFGLYLQGLYGDFRSWKAIPVHHWKQHFVQGRVDRIAFNAETSWRQNKGMGPNVALQRFKALLNAYV